LASVREFLVAQLRAHRPRTLVLEHIPRRPLDTLAGLPALGRLLGRLARQRRLKVATYSARTVRGSVVGDGWAGKRQVAESIAGRFPDLRVHLTHDRKWKERYWQNMFDAVALALHHQSVSKPPSRSRRSG
jgi:Holliday junction resolvasome RuvABC endonuclease subunit